MKKIVASILLSFILVSIFSFAVPRVRAEISFSRPSLPDGPEHTNELVDVIFANTTKVLIVTEGWGPLTGISPIQEKDFWVSILSGMPGEFDVDWFDGVPTFELLNGYDLVIFDAGGYWYPLSHVALPLRQYHFTGKPLIVVAPDINYDWNVNGEPVPSFARDVLHIQGVLGIMPEAVYDVYADTGHEIVYGVPKDIGIDIPAVTSWPDCFEPKADCGKVLRQGYIPETEFGVGTCSDLPRYSPYDPEGKLFAVVAYAGSDNEGRVVTYGFPISGLVNTKIAKELAVSSIEWALKEKMVRIDLTLYIEDAVKGKDENAAPIVNKAPGDKIDIVATVCNKEKDTYNIDVIFEVPSDLSFNKGFIRNDFCDVDEKTITPNKDGNKYTVTINLESGKSKQIVFRFDISKSAKTTICPLVFASVKVGGKVCNFATAMYNMVDNAKALIVTNRHLLIQRYGLDDRIDRALNWAFNELGSYTYKNRCLRFVWDAYEKGAGASFEWPCPISAKEAANKLSDKMHSGTPPRGAYVFYDCWGTLDGTYANWGHVGLSCGDGKIIHAFGKVRVDNYLDVQKLSPGAGWTYPTYIGWAWPTLMPSLGYQFNEGLLSYLYKISDWREQNCIVYYVDHYDESLKSWNQNVDYASEASANIVANKIDDLIEDWYGRTSPKYLMIVGGDEIIPFYRVKDPTTTGSENDYAYNSDDPVLDAMDHDYFISDNLYADIDGKDIDKGELELITGRIIGCSTSDMKKFIENGLKGPSTLNKVVVASLTEATNREWDADWAITELKKKWTITDESVLNDNNNWRQKELTDALQKGFVIFAYFAHGEYDRYATPDLEANEIDDVDSNYCISNNRPFIANDGCRLGIITDEDGINWNPEWDDCIMYALVRHGISGSFGAGGIMYWWGAEDVARYGELFGNDFFKELKIKSGSKTVSVGEAFIQAKKNYDPSNPNFDSYDKKTMLEYILFGVPWMAIDPSETVTDQTNPKDPQVEIRVSEPTRLPDGSYLATIEVNVTGYSVIHLNGFDIVSISGADLKGGVLKPQIPMAEIPILLPRESIISSVTVKESTSISIGLYNIPSIGLVPETIGGISYTDQTDVVGYYPSESYYVDVSTFEGFERALIYIPLIRHNPQTDETILLNYMKFELRYQIPTPLLLKTFTTDKTEYFFNEPITTTFELQNIGTDTLFGVTIDLALKDCHGKVVASKSSQTFDLIPGETKEVPIVLYQELPHGTYLLEAEVIGGSTLSFSSTYISILSGGIVDFSAPSKVKSGEDVTFDISFMNSKSAHVSGECAIYLYDVHGIEIAELYSSLTTFPANSITQIQITWSTTGKEYGTYTASAMVYAGDESFGPSYRVFEITPPDDIPPTTTLTIGNPKYVDSMGNIYVSPVTPFILTAEDNIGGMGVASTFYRIYNNTYNSDWLEYSAPFYLTGLSDGEYSIDYYSIDNIGNVEPTNTATIILDNTPPTTTLTIGEPKYASGITYVTPDTSFTLEATDTSSGVYSSVYRIHNSTYDSGWMTYTGPFYLTSLTDGTYTIEYYSIDNVQNIEAARAINVTLFSWNYIFEDTYGRGTILKINIANKFFQFITPDKDYGIRKATYMRQCGRAIIIHHYDDELRLITTAVDTKLGFCVAIAWDQQTGKRYFLIDKVGNE